MEFKTCDLEGIYDCEIIILYRVAKTAYPIAPVEIKVIR